MLVRSQGIDRSIEEEEEGGDATARLLLCGYGPNSDAETREYDTRTDFRFLCFLSIFTFRRRDVADLADVDEEESEEQDVPPHVELQ